MTILDRLRKIFRCRVGEVSKTNKMEHIRARAARIKTHSVAKEARELEKRMNAMEHELMRGREWRSTKR